MAEVISMKEMAAIFNHYASVYDLLTEDNKEGGREGWGGVKRTIKGANHSEKVAVVSIKATF